MNQIISREQIRERARRAFAAGHGRDDHNMNWHAAALPTWLGEYDRLVAERRHDGERQFFKKIGEGKPT